MQLCQCHPRRASARQAASQRLSSDLMTSPGVALVRGVRSHSDDVCFADEQKPRAHVVPIGLHTFRPRLFAARYGMVVRKATTSMFDVCMFDVGSRQMITDMDSKRATTKCIATALVCHPS